MQNDALRARDNSCSACTGSGECPRCAGDAVECGCHGSGVCGACLGTGSQMEIAGIASVGVAGAVAPSLG